VPIRLHILENVLNLPIRVDHKRRPGDSHDFLAVHVLFFEHPERPGDLLVGICQQRKGKLFLLLKFLLRFWRIWGDAKQHGAGFLNLSICVAEPASFCSSPRCVGARVKKNDDRLALQVLQREWPVVLILQSELRSFIMDMHGSVSPTNEAESEE